MHNMGGEADAPKKLAVAVFKCLQSDLSQLVPVMHIAGWLSGKSWGRPYHATCSHHAATAAEAASRCCLPAPDNHEAIGCCPAACMAVPGWSAAGNGTTAPGEGHPPPPPQAPQFEPYGCDDKAKLRDFALSKMST